MGLSPDTHMHVPIPALHFGIVLIMFQDQLLPMKQKESLLDHLYYIILVSPLEMRYTHKPCTQPVAFSETTLILVIKTQNQAVKTPRTLNTHEVMYLNSLRNQLTLEVGSSRGGLLDWRFPITAGQVERAECFYRKN